LEGSATALWHACNNGGPLARARNEERRARFPDIFGVHSRARLEREKAAPVDGARANRYRCAKLVRSGIAGEDAVTNRHLIVVATVVAAASMPALATAAAPAVKKPAAPASAQNGPKPMTRAQFLANVQERFNAIDTNHDGVLDEKEIAAAQQKELEQARAIEQQRLEAEFTRLDTNKDGQLSKAEFMAALPPVQARQTPQQIVAAFDSNKDGKVTLQEYEARPLATFNRLDTNKDGTVSPAEIDAARNPKKR
jgi:hypothetical protein